MYSRANHVGVTGSPVTAVRTVTSAASSAAASSHDLRPGTVSSTSVASSPPMPTCHCLPNSANGSQVSTACTASACQRYRWRKVRPRANAYSSGIANKATVNGTSPDVPDVTLSDTRAASSSDMPPTVNPAARRCALEAPPEPANRYICTTMAPARTGGNRQSSSAAQDVQNAPAQDAVPTSTAR